MPTNLLLSLPLLVLTCQYAYGWQSSSVVFSIVEV